MYYCLLGEGPTVPAFKGKSVLPLFLEDSKVYFVESHQNSYYS